MTSLEFFNIDDAWAFAKYFDLADNPVLWLKKIKSAIEKANLNSAGKSKKNIPVGCVIGENVFIHETVKLPPVCVINGPAYIDEGTEIRPFAYIRENVIIGKNCVIGNSCELKNSILLNNVAVPHFNYVGDSVLGNFVHLGAGVILANLRLDKKEIIVHHGGERIVTKMRKIGAIIGDNSEISCNTVLNPGTVLSKNSVIFQKKFQ